MTRLADGTWGFDGRITELPTDAGSVSFDAAGQRIVMTCHSDVVPAARCGAPQEDVSA